MSIRHLSAATAFVLATGGCRSPSSPTAPGATAARAETVIADTSPGSDITLPISGPSDVSFPPRNEPLLFRTALESPCIPMGGRPARHVFNIPNDFPAGPIQARVYFNPNVTQPSGNAAGTVAFTYNPQ